MNKYTLGVTLQDDRYCEGCPGLHYDRCTRLNTYLDFIKKSEYVLNHIRPQECPLEKAVLCYFGGDKGASSEAISVKGW